MVRTVIVLTFCISFGTLKCQNWCMVDSSFEGYYQGNSINNEVSVFKTINNELYAGGVFMLKGVYPETFFLAKWNGLAWSRLGNIMPNDGQIRSIENYNNRLYASGDFDSLEGNDSITKFAMFENGQWNKVNNFFTESATTTIYALKTYKNKLYVAGNGFYIGSTNYPHIAVWNDTTFEQVGGGIDPGYMAAVYCMEVFNDELIVGGSFGYADTILTPYLAKWNGSQWLPFGDSIFIPVARMAVDTINNILYCPAYINYVNGIQRVFIGKWDGSTWTYIPTPLNGFTAIYVNNGDLYVGGASYNNSITDTIVARWDGQNWHHIKGPNGYVTGITIYKDDLYIGGGFTQVDSMTIYGIARYGEGCITGINKLSIIKNQLSIYPNPTDSQFTIETEIPQGNKGAIKVYGLSGELKKSISINTENKIITLDVSDWEKGTYICVLEQEGKKIESKRFVVQ